MVEATIEEVVLALTEACANVVQHAGEHDEYQVDVEIDGEVCRLCVFDHGDGFDPATTLAPTSPLDGGRGLLLMRALVDRLHPGDGCPLPARARRRDGPRPGAISGTGAVVVRKAVAQ